MRLRSFGRHTRTAANESDENYAADRRRTSLTAALIALITVVAVSALAASAAAPSHVAKPTAQHRPTYLQPVGALVHHGYLPFPALLGDSGTVGVPSGTKPTPTRPDPAVAAQQAPAIAPFEGATGTLTPAGIATLALEHGCNPAAAPTATAIAMAESGGSPAAQGDIGLMTDVWDWSAGLWQVRGLRDERGTGELRDSIANQNADTNAAAMYVISSGCTDWTPWSTYNTGAYLQFLSIAEQAVRYVTAYFAAHDGHYPAVGAPDPTASIPVQGSGATTSGQGSGAAATPTQRRSVAPKPASSPSARHRAPQPHASGSSAPPQPAPAPSAQPTQPKPSLSLSVPKLTLPPLPKPSLSLPKPSLSLPLPSLSVPSLTGLP